MHLLKNRLLYVSVFTAIGIQDVPRTVGIIQPILLLLFVGASRALARIWLGDQYQSILKSASRPKVLIYGAGRTGRQLVAAMANSHEMQVVGFLDDDDRLHGHVLNGQPIYNPSDLASLVPTLPISDVLLAMSNLSRKRRNEILNEIRSAQVSSLVSARNRKCARMPWNGQSSESFPIDPQHYSGVWEKGSKQIAFPPPIQDAQLFSVGRFHLGHPQSTRGAAQFYVCQPPPVLGAVLTPKSHIPPSLLTKLLQTLMLWHTQNAFHANNLRVCRIRRFCYRLAEANHEVCVLAHTTL